MSNAEPGSSKNKPSGCLYGCLTVFIILLLILFAGYYTFFHTAAPLKWVAGKVESGLQSQGVEFQLKGLDGSISKGVTIEELVFPGDAGTSTISDLTFRYENIRNWFKGEVVITELSASQSDFMVGADAFKQSGDTASTETEVTVDTHSSKMNGLFELRKLHFENTRFHSADGAVDIYIPLIRLAGLKIGGDDFELAEFEIISNYINVQLSDASPQNIDGLVLPFKRRLDGTVQPGPQGIPGLVINPITFSLEMGASKGEPCSRLIAFEGAWRQHSLPGKASHVQLKDFSFGTYLDCSEHMMPERLTMTIREKDDVVKVSEGTFNLGKTQFVIRPQTLDANDDPAAISAKAQVAGREIDLRLRTNKSGSWPPLHMELVGGADKELLAQIYYQRGYGQLETTDKTRIDTLIAK